nr:MAG TPA: hypothetical protein [Caudoviricetes sp.]
MCCYFFYTDRHISSLYVYNQRTIKILTIELLDSIVSIFRGTKIRINNQ